jgi:hypothetical protein
MSEIYDDATKQFIAETFELELEHSLASLSKWEAIFEKPFLGSDGKSEKTSEEVFEYVKLMTLTPNVPEEVFNKLSVANFTEIERYIQAKASATWFSDGPDQRRTHQIITAEVIYSWMIDLNIWLECERWHLSRLFTLIRVCSQKNAPQKKMGRNELLQKQRELNAQRRAKLGTSG